MVDYFKRKKQIQELMGAKDVDAMLIAGAENYYYITGDYRRQVRAHTWVNDVRVGAAPPNSCSTSLPR